MTWPGADNKQNCAPCTLQRGQVEYEEGDEKGEERKSQADHWNLNTVGQAGQWKPLKFGQADNWNLNTDWSLRETLGDILIISSSTSTVLLDYCEKIFCPPIKTNWMNTLWALSAIDKL